MALKSPFGRQDYFALLDRMLSEPRPVSTPVIDSLRQSLERRKLGKFTPSTLPKPRTPSIFGQGTVATPSGGFTRRS